MARLRSSVLRPATDSFIEGLETRVLLSTTPVPLTTPLNTSSGQVQGVLQSVAKLDDLANEVLKVDAQLANVIGKLPLVGDGVKSAIGGANDKFKDVATTVENALKTLSNPTITGVDIQNALYAALGPSGANILPATITSASQVPVELSDTNGDTASAEQVDLNLDLKGTIFTTNLNPSFDLGLPALGLTLNGNVQAQLSYDIHLDIGVNGTDFFYLNLGRDNPEISLTLDITTPGLTATGHLGFLQINASDGTSKGTTKLTGTITADLGVTGDKLTPGNLASLTSNSKLSADAEADLHLHNVLSFGGSAKFPSFQADLDLTWKLGNVSLDSGGVSATSGSEPDLQFNNVKLDVGTFFSNFVTPVFKEVQDILGPLQPLFDLLNTRMPIFSDIGFLTNKFDDNGDGKVSLLELLHVISGGDTSFLDAVNKINDITKNGIPTVGGGVLLDLGSFEIGGDANVNGADIRSLTDLSGINLTTINGLDLSSVLGGLGPVGTDVGDFLDGLAKGLPGGGDTGFHLPIIEHPSTAFGLLLGKNVDLFTFDTPTLDLSAPLDEFFSILGPLGVELKGNLDDAGTFAQVRAHLSGGYDTAGLVEFANGGFHPVDLPDLFDGFYVLDDPTKTYAHAGLGVSAYAALNVVVASAGVGGGINGTIDFAVNDPGEDTPPTFDDGLGKDGRLRPKEVIADIAMSPLCLFDITGKITASLDAFVKVGFDTWLGFVGWQKHWTLAETTLADFSFGCDSMPASPPVLATLGGDGTLTLNMGPHAGDRASGDTADGDESFVVTHLSTEGDGTETVNVVAFGYVQKYSGVKKIYAEGGAGNDSVELRGVASPAELYGDFVGAGGDGNDSLTAADGPATLHGGGGDDQLTTTGGASTMYGDGGNDLLTGAGGNDSLDGGEGDDRIFGRDGNDTLVGGAGVDDLDGEGGDDTLDGGTEDDHLTGGAGNDNLAGGDGNDVLEGNDGSDTLAGGNGNDLIFGDNVLPPSTSFGTITAGSNLLAGKFIKVLTGPSYGVNLLPGGDADTITGGDGNDQLYGEGGDDSISGGDGNDYAQGNDGNDTLSGDAGNDALIGNLGNDSISGGVGNDTLLGDGGEVSFGGIALPSDTASDGNDTLNGGDASDQLYGQGGADLVSGGADADTLSGGAGNDTIHGDGGNDSMAGGAGADLMSGDAGNDTMSGDAGNDTMTGDAGDDLMNGGDDNDSMSGGTGNETISGNAGNDTITGDDGNDSLSGGTGNDLISGNNDNDTVSGDAGNDTLFGNAGADFMSGGDDNDLMSGGTGNDTMAGDGGNDVMTGDEDNDSMSGGAGNDLMSGNDGADSMNGGDGDDSMQGNAGNDTIAGDANDDDIVGGAGSDLISGGTGHDVILGDDGTIVRTGQIVFNTDSTPRTPERVVTLSMTVVGAPDTITGDDGSDRIWGQDGNDSISGGNGDDDLIGNAGDDSISGGAGSDVILGDDGAINTPAGVTPAAMPENTAILRTAVPASLVLGGNDVITGDDQNDVIYGQGGNDTVFAGAGDDYVEGNAGSDSISGDAGNDDLIGGSSVAGTPDDGDVISGGDGHDVIVGDNGTIARTVLPGNVWDRYTAGVTPGTGRGAENNAPIRTVTLLDRDTIGGADTESGGTGDDTMFGGLGNDSMAGNDGNDDMTGNLGDDTMDGGAGSDGILGDNGTIVTDLLDGSTQTTLSPQGNFVTLTVNTAGTLARYVTLVDPSVGGNDVITGGDGNDFVHAGAGTDSVSGGAGDDALFGDDGNDTVSGNDGADHIYGGAGNDSLDGNAGADLIYGGDGDDWLVADNADDRLIDWFGNYNNFVVPGPSYGAKVVLRSPAPPMQQFLVDLAKADGSLNPDSELLIVTPPSPDNSGPGGRTT